MHWALLIVALLVAQSPAQPPGSDRATTSGETPARAAEFQRRTWMVDGVERMALIHTPAAAKETATPVVFAFHGHGGNARQASRSFRMHDVWPEAIVVYMEGLPTPGALTDPEGKRNGWQNLAQGDRDLKFFDAVLASLRKDLKVDDRRIYAMGHSNGGGFTFTLWRARADTFAAMAPSGAYTGLPRTLKAKPVMHIAGRKDALVKFDLQERTMEAVRSVNGCEGKGTAWAKDCTLYESKQGAPMVTLIYDGGHQFPSAAPPLIARFFKEHPPAKPEAAPATTTDAKAPAPTGATGSTGPR